MTGVKKLIYAALFLSLGMVLPLFTAQIKEIGDTLLPMHLPVMLCGLICGWQYGSVVGFVLPFFRSVVFGMPPLFPNGVWMALELATYGLVIGILYARSKKNLGSVYGSLLASMLAGRVVWGISKALLLGADGKAFPLAAFITGGFIDAIPGMVLQLVLIPLLVKLIVEKKDA